MKKMALLLALILCFSVFASFMGCARIANEFGLEVVPAEPVTEYSALAEKMDRQARADFYNSVITKYQRDDIRKLICDWQAEHNKKAKNSDVSNKELDKDFDALKENIQAIYNRN